MTKSLTWTPCLVFCFASATAGAELPPPAEFGGITYPARGNVQLDEGTLDLWVISQFDTDTPAHKTDGDRNWRWALFQLQFPDNNWNYTLQYISWANAFAMLGHKHAYVWGGPSHWKPGEAHHVVLTWSGGKRSIFIDGICEWKGPKGLNVTRDLDVQVDLEGDLTSALIQIGGGYSHLTVDEAQIRRIALTRDEIIKAKDSPLTADVYTLLLDHCDGGPPEIVQGDRAVTTLAGKYEIVDGKFGKAIRLWKEKK